MKVEHLKKYCEEHDIFVPRDATKRYLERVIVRHFLTTNEVECPVKNCFGFWEHENGECLCCTLKEKCRATSIGMDWDKYRKAVDKLYNKKIRFS